MKKVLLIALIMAFSLVFAATSFAAIWCANPGGTGVCSPTVQEAIDMANPGDTVQVWPGRYYENLIVDVDDIILEGVDVTITGYGEGGFFRPPTGAPSTTGADPKKVIIDGYNGCTTNGSSPMSTPGHTGIYIMSHDVTVRNLTVDHSYCDFNIYSEGNNTTITNVRVIDGWGGIYISPLYITAQPNGEMLMSATVTKSLVSANGPGGGINIFSDIATVTDNRVLNNFNSGVFVGSSLLCSGSQPTNSNGGVVASIKRNEVRAIGADLCDIIPCLCPTTADGTCENTMDETYDPLQLPESPVHGNCISLGNSHDSEVSSNTISNCALIGIDVWDGYNLTVKSNTINSAILGIVLDGVWESTMTFNTVNGSVAGLISCGMGPGAAEVKQSILSGNLLLDVGQLQSDYESAMEAAAPLEVNGFPSNTYASNTVTGATIVGYVIFDGYALIEKNSADNVPSSLLGGFLYDSLCGYLMGCCDCVISENYAANSSAGFYLDVYNATITKNTAEYNSWFGFLVEMYGETTLSLNKAKYNGGSERWTGGFEIMTSSSGGNTISGNTATENVNGMNITAYNYELVTGNTVSDNRIQGMTIMGGGQSTSPIMSLS